MHRAFDCQRLRLQGLTPCARGDKRRPDCGARRTAATCASMEWMACAQGARTYAAHRGQGRGHARGALLDGRRQAPLQWPRPQRFAT
eukprot:9420258-Alexandrium_andersonii.AAC.2